ncbi:MAG TPA: M13 family metallopeptidase [Pyrinomonadaceae bacterium]|jgi:putative endopeptidase
MTNLRRKLGAGAALFLFCTMNLAQNPAFDTSRIDASVDVCTDFYRHVNGNWLKKNEIPAAFPSYGTWDILITNTRQNSRDILEAAMKNKAAKGTSEQLTGDYYASCMDLEGIEAEGTKPLESFFKDIEKIKNAKDLQSEIASLHRTGVGAVFGFYAGLDEANSSMNIANVYQGGLSLPNKDYYTNTDDKSKEVREKFVAHVARMFELSGEPAETAKTDADTVMKIEMRLALASKTPVELRDPKNYYNKMSVTEANKLTANFDWNAYAAKLGTPKFAEINLGEPDFFKEAGKMLTEVAVGDWKTYLRWNVLNSFAARLPQRFDDEDFNFNGKVLSGTTEQFPRWRRCTRATDNSLGEALGEQYVKKYFTPEMKKRMDALIDNLFASYREHINRLDWMSDATRKQALAKLEMIKRKIGYPDKLRGYAGLIIDRRSYFANQARVNEFLVTRDLKDIGSAPDKARWGMTAATVNAQYSSNYNDITFPAAILQPPFFDFKADDALNYGAIGAVIGHELTHGFDDSGSRYDGAGNLKMWWTDDDRKKFEEKADCVTQQFNGFEVEKGLFVNGGLTLGENLADLGGLAIAYDAFEKSMEGKPRPAKTDGYTPEQRFFLGYAQIWAENDRPEYARFLVQSDPHSLSVYRVNGPLSNLPEFAAAFSCKMGDKMVSRKQCRVW